MSEKHPVSQEVDVYTARRVIREYAETLGFSRIRAGELSIVVSELASNIVKYGVRGEIRWDVIQDPEHGVGVRVVAVDEGPPIKDIALAMRDGFTDEGPIDPAAMLGRRGIGGGLGAVQRLSDRFEYHQGNDKKELIIVKFKTDPKRRRR